MEITDTTVSTPIVSKTILYMNLLGIMKTEVLVHLRGIFLWRVKLNFALGASGSAFPCALPAGNLMSHLNGQDKYFQMHFCLWGCLHNFRWHSTPKTYPRWEKGTEFTFQLHPSPLKIETQYFRLTQPESHKVVAWKWLSFHSRILSINQYHSYRLMVLGVFYLKYCFYKNLKLRESFF